MTSLVVRSLAVLSIALWASIGFAQSAPPMQGQGVNMPDARQMSGTPLPASELPPGTLTVRVVRGAMTNPLPGQQVEISGATSAAARTNEAGRAEFSGLPIGRPLKASAVVEGERLESQEFSLPAAGGIRIALVAVDPEIARREEEDRKLAQGPARSGIVVFSDQSRIVFELGEDGLNVFNIFEIQNTARTPVNPPVPVIFDLPAAAEHAALLEGSSPLAAVKGRQVTVSGPFPPGPTLVQFAYTMPYSGGAVTVSQRLPAALAQVTLIAQQVGTLEMVSEQVGPARALQAEGGVYLVAQGRPLAAGDAITVAFSGLPGVPVWPRNLALALAAVVLIGGAAAAFRGTRGAGARGDRDRLVAERERLLEELTALEASHRDGRVDAGTFAASRRKLVVDLERVYAALDEDVAA